MAVLHEVGGLEVAVCMCGRVKYFSLMHTGMATQAYTHNHGQHTKLSFASNATK